MYLRIIISERSPRNLKKQHIKSNCEGKNCFIQQKNIYKVHKLSLFIVKDKSPFHQMQKKHAYLSHLYLVLDWTTEN